ncbi:wnt ligand secretion mediator [Brevipalpus obovatus]|uniref:wnt ligand secretion mediator n=1 Tax=Brevipalpus obovatus TaxID=246614 RepID=UPI003D9F0D29
MAGTVLENLSNRKLICVLSVILAFLVISFLIGAFIAPAPSNTEQIMASLCVPNDVGKLSIPRDKIDKGRIISKNCEKNFNATDKPVFAFQIPGPREGQELDYSRWMSYLITMLTPEIVFRGIPSPGTDYEHLNGTLVMKVVLAAKDISDTHWTIIAKKDSLSRTLSCKLPKEKLEDGIAYDCNAIQFFELQSLYYDYYLINLEFISAPELHHSQLSELNMVVIHQNGGFGEVFLFLKSIFFAITLLTLVWYYNRLRQLWRKNTLLEKSLLVLGMAITQLNVPVEYLSLFFDLGFMNFLSDIRQGILHCALFCFWRIFTGEHLLDGIQRSRLSLYYRDLSIILTASTLLFVFDSIERGVQWIDPFFTIWEVESKMAIIFISTAILAALTYFLFLCYQVWLVRKNIATKRSSLPAMSSTRRLVYEGIIYRFNFLLVATIFSAAATFIAYIMTQMGDTFFWEDEYTESLRIQWTSAMYTFVYAMWNCYILILLILYAPSHKGRGSQFDNLSEEIEFNRLTTDETNENTVDTSAPSDSSKSFKFSKLSKSDMQLLQDLAAHQSID